MEPIKEKFGSIEKATDVVLNFHGKKNVPGIYVGVYMLDFGLRKFYENFKEKENKEIKFNAVCETDFCLPDVLQALMHLTIGVRYLKIINFDGKFACTLYDRDDGKGIRVGINITKIDKEKFSDVYKFFTRTRKEHIVTEDARKRNNEEVIAQFMSMKEKDNLFSYKVVKVNFTGKEEKLPAKICKICRESFLSKEKDVCQTCSGENKPYFTYL
ncbi:MAG: hypothetical protein BWK75_05230 [Candidatus Altiarchaeales archaeon A3]|nr:MAG: hypothetical protein BWK75_05230 [Candidatus Altiarchaeales archaeon A3]